MAKSKRLIILQYIYDEVQSKGFPPTVREICEAVGLSSTSTVHGYLSRLEAAGLISRDRTKPRAIEITDEGLQTLGVLPDQIPLVGTVTAGAPITAVENIEGFYPLPPDMSKKGAPLFMLEIRGNSMINAGILSGDYVICRQQSSADNGDIVIAMTDEDEATCKTFYKEKDYFRLQPENDSMDPIILDQVTILGKVTGLYRANI